jgi:hypothetical protein
MDNATFDKGGCIQQPWRLLYLSKELILRNVKIIIDFSRFCNKNALLPCLEFQDSNPKEECPQTDMYLLVVKSSELNIY